MARDRARRTLRGIDEQVAKAEKDVTGKVAVKRNRFVKLTGGERNVNKELEANVRALAGPTPTCKPGRSTTASASRSRPTSPVVFAPLAITRLIEDRTGWSIKEFVRTSRRYRSVRIRAGAQVLTAEDPLPPELRDALALIN